MNSDSTSSDPLLIVNTSNAGGIVAISPHNETDVVPSLQPTNSTHDNIHGNGEEPSILELRLSILAYILVPFMFLLCLRPGSAKSSTRRFRDEREALEAYAARRQRSSNQQRNENEKKNNADPEERKKIVEKSLITSTISSYDGESGGIILFSDTTSPTTEKEEEKSGNEEIQQELNCEFDDDEACSCMICLEPYTAGEKVSYFKESSLDCRHVFHHECISEWLMGHDECPGCRTSFLIMPDQEDKNTEKDQVEQADEENEQEIDLELGKCLVEDKTDNSQVLQIVDGLISKSTTKRQGLTYSRVSVPENGEKC